MMEITILKMLLKNISSFYQLSSHENTKCEPIDKYYCKTDEILKLLKPILDDIIDIDIASHEKLHKALSGTIQYIDELKETVENWQPLMSKVYLVFQAESLISKIQASALEIYELLISSEESELSVASLEQTIQKTKNIELEKTSDIITKAIKDQNEGPGASPESLAKVADYVSLNSNQELLIEAVALEKLKENAEQGEKNNEVEFIDQMLNLVTHMHDQLVMFKQSQSCSPVTIPPDFCCPLSIELMTDPVIVASGQTYERAFIRNWIDLGLNVCPKTRQPLSHSNLIPNYTVKALIANWCESNNVKLPDPIKSMSLNQPSALLGKIDSNVLTQSRVNPSINNTSPDRGSNVASSHHHSSSEESLPELPLPENGHELDIENTNEEASQSHIRTASASSTVSISKLSLGTSSDNGNESNNNDVTSDEVTSQPTRQVETMTNLPLRVSEFPSRTRNQQIWRRPSDRFVPRIVQSSSTETRPDLSEVEARVKSLIEELKNPSINEQRKATSDLRLLAKHNMDNRIVIANCGAIPILVNLLLSTDSEIQENAVTALLNLSINDNNKAAIANANAIEPLIYVLETGSSEAKENSAATLFSLSVIEDNKVKIGRSGAIKPLVDLLGNGTPRGKKDASTALFNLSILHENKGRIVQAGAVKYLVELMDPAAGMVDKAVAVLSNLATIPEGRLAIGQEGGITVLVEVVELGSARGKENAAAALLQLCTNSSRFCNMVLQEGAVPPLVALLQSGTPRAREKAQALLSYFRNQRHGNAGRG